MFFTFLLLLGAGLMTFGIYSYSIKKKQITERLSAYNALALQIPNFNVDKSYTDNEAMGMIALCVSEKRVLLARGLTATEKKYTNDIINHRTAYFNEILRSEVIVDGQNISSTSAGGALVGGLLFGVVGAVVGSNNGKTTYSKDVTQISLKLLLNDIKNPTYELCFYKKGVNKCSVAEAQQLCQHWQDTLSVAAVN